MTLRKNYHDTDADRLKPVRVRSHHGSSHRFGRGHRMRLQILSVIESIAVTAVKLNKQMPPQQLGHL
jgi:hypothetical protein